MEGSEESPPAPQQPAIANPVAFVRMGEPRSEKVIPLESRALPLEQPSALSKADAQRIVRQLSAETENIVILPYGRRRASQRAINRRQIELCVQKGTIVEGPFLNDCVEKPLNRPPVEKWLCRCVSLD
jgi:hypothetical protein